MLTYDDFLDPRLCFHYVSITKFQLGFLNHPKTVGKKINIRASKHQNIKTHRGEVHTITRQCQLFDISTGVNWITQYASGRWVLFFLMVAFTYLNVKKNNHQVILVDIFPGKTKNELEI